MALIFIQPETSASGQMWIFTNKWKQPSLELFDANLYDYGLDPVNWNRTDRRLELLITARDI